MEIIKSPSNKLIKHIKSLYNKKYRDIYKEFIVEGLKITKEALDSEWEFSVIVFSEDFCNSKDFSDLKNIIDLKNVKTSTVADELFYKICDTENPQGILAVMKMPQTQGKPGTAKTSGRLVTAGNPETDESRGNVAGHDLGKYKKLVILDSLNDPGNMGTIIRTADSFGVDAVITSEDCVDIYNSKTLRAAMGSIFHIPVYKANIEKVIPDLKNMGYKIYAAHLKGEDLLKGENLLKGGNLLKGESCLGSEYCLGSKNYENSPIAIIIGNEANGIKDNIASFADKLVKIPMPGRAESLNASVAAGILMYEIFL